MQVVQGYPRFFSMEAESSIANLIALDEIKRVQSGFAKSKSHGLDGWTV